jgi:hypothetical protein
MTSRHPLPHRRAADTVVVRWWPVEKEIPKGWKLSEVYRLIHHNRWSVLLERAPSRRKVVHAINFGPQP